jgi:hypothetical protein
MTRTFAAAILTLCVITVPLHAAITNDDAYYRADAFCGLCTVDNEETRIACNSFIMGVVSYNSDIQIAGGPHLICPPKTLTIKDAARLFLSYCKSQPETQLEDTASASVISALHQAYPCSQER